MQDSFIHLIPGTRDQIASWVKLSDAAADQKVTVRIAELSIEKTVATDNAGVAEFSLSDKRLQLWSPDHPKLYKVEIESGSGGSSTDLEKDKIAHTNGPPSLAVSGHEIVLH